MAKQTKYISSDSLTNKEELQHVTTLEWLAEYLRRVMGNELN